ncbi:MAG TPA: HipA domain-containing protein [Gemmatimonadales bacterium]|nr:HipA domain-containing protein [Gemmatimonadales bacterium]
MSPRERNAPNEVNVLGVWLGERRAGTLVRLPDDRVTFAFDPGYAADPDRPTLSLGFKGSSGGLVTPPMSKTKLPPFFANLLPEGELRTYLAARAGVKEVRDFPLIALLGGDLPGNVTVRAEGEDEAPIATKMDADTQSRPLKFSLAGVQLKFSAIENAAGGLTIPVSGAGGEWIIKLPSMRFPQLPLHEYLMLELARQVGIGVPATRLIEAHTIAGLPHDVALPEPQALTVQRFDRAPEERVHAEDFAQVFGVYPDQKYEVASSASLGRVVYAESGLSMFLEYVRRLVFTVLIGNGDMHLKNWSLMYPDGRKPVLAPAYDFVGTIVYMPPGESLGLSLSRTKRFAAVSMRHFRRLANHVGAPQLPVTETVQETIRAFQRAWREGDVAVRLPAGQRERLQEHLETLDLWRI